jgi:hypothetical protein
MSMREAAIANDVGEKTGKSFRPAAQQQPPSGGWSYQ